MKPRNGGVGPHDSRRPRASFDLTTLGWAIALCVTIPVWVLARALALLVWLPSEGAYRVRLWSAPLIHRALTRLGFGS